MAKDRFYDIHFHAMDLSHANITAFISRFFEDEDIFLNKKFIKKQLKKNFPIWKKMLLPLVPNSLLAKKILKGIKENKILDEVENIRNLLSFMESSILYDFLILDYFLKNKESIVSENNEFKIGSLEYNKIVICPLIMDFGYKNIHSPEIFYNIPPQKPITSQIRDLFKSIHTYYHNEIEVKKQNSISKFNIYHRNTDKKEKLFEIYPFMGINTQNYTYEEIEEMLTKYFSDFKGNDTLEERRKKLFDKMGEFDGDLEQPSYDYSNIFAGIKVYPPLGFEPWPENNEEKMKVELLYKTCVEKNIPVISHCSTGGFKVTDRAGEFTDPGNQWAKVLQAYPALKIDFAHFGSGDKKWRKTIIKSIKKYENVYADFSCNTHGDEYYKELKQTLINNPNQKLDDRILFGSDFMINLIWLKSYNEYLKIFIDTSYLNDEIKSKFTNRNSEKFLYG
jgi:hypothetical protein